MWTFTVTESIHVCSSKHCSSLQHEEYCDFFLTVSGPDIVESLKVSFIVSSKGNAVLNNSRSLKLLACYLDLQKIELTILIEHHYSMIQLPLKWWNIVKTCQKFGSVKYIFGSVMFELVPLYSANTITLHVLCSHLI